MHECGGLERASRTLATQVRGGTAAQLGVDDRHHPLGGIPVARRPRLEQPGDVVNGGVHENRRADSAELFCCAPNIPLKE